MGEHHFALWPVILYGVALFLAAISSTLLVIVIKKTEGVKILKENSHCYSILQVSD